MIPKNEICGMTNINWNILEQSNTLDQIDQRSFETPQLIYKHSTRCSISTMVLNRLDRSWNAAEIGNLDANFLDLINYRSLSNAIAERYGVYHESPQVIIIAEGKAVYHNSHMGISFSAIKDALGEVSA